MRLGPVFYILILVVASPVAAQGPYDSLPGVAPSDFFVEVEWNNSWGRTTSARMDALGGIQMAVVTLDSNARKDAVVDVAVAQHYLCRLVAMGFFEYPEEYQSGGAVIVTQSNGNLVLLEHAMSDAGSTSVRMVFGERVHQLKMWYPPSKVPQQFVQWCNEFRYLVDSTLVKR